MSVQISSLLHDIVVRPLTSVDVPKVRELHSRVLPVRYPPSFFVQLLVLPGRVCLVAHRRSQPHTPIAFISGAIQQPLAVYNGLSLDSPSLWSHVSQDAASHPLAGLDSRKPRVEILTLGVLPLYQHRGLAQLLMHCIVQKMCNIRPDIADGTLIYANVSTSNAPALKFYKQMGMHISSEAIKNLYRTISHGSKDAYFAIGLFSNTDLGNEMYLDGV